MDIGIWYLIADEQFDVAFQTEGAIILGDNSVDGDGVLEKHEVYVCERSFNKFGVACHENPFIDDFADLVHL